MVLVKQRVRPVYRYVPDRHYASGDKYVLQRNVQFIFLTAISGERARDRDPVQVLNDMRVVQTINQNTLSFRVPSLTSQPNTTYSRSSYIAGSDYEQLSASEYDWKLARSWYEQTEEFNDVTFTFYLISGRWDKYQGISYNIQRS